MSEANLRRRLKIEGFSSQVQDGEALSPLDEALLEIQDKHNIDYCGPVAGYEAGEHEMMGRKVLVTESLKLVVPKEGSAPVLLEVLEGMLDDPEYRQMEYLFGWLRYALECLYTRQFKPGQALVLAGPAECGKSLFQGLLTIMLGGKDASPYQYMTGVTPFNSELFGAGHLKVEDEVSSTDLRMRRDFGNKIKQFASPGSQLCHPKGREPINLLAFRRVSISVNDEPENLLVLPPFEGSVMDKIILLRVKKEKMPMPLNSLTEQRAFWDTLVSELPAFVYWLLNTWEIPDDLRSDRYGITYFQHPALLEAMGDLNPETHLLTLVDRVLFSGLITEAWEGSASELQSKLSETPSVARETEKLLKYFNNCGTYLGKLMKQQPDRLASKKVKGHTIWIINPPNAGQATESV